MNLLPNNMIIEFEEIYSHRSANSAVLIFDKIKKQHTEKLIFRDYSNYGKTPKFDASINKSFMFLGDNNQSLPKTFENYFIFAKQIDNRYNQLTVNYYSPEDYIEMHSDCSSKFLKEDCPILVININETDDLYAARNITFVNKQTGLMHSKVLLNNCYFTIDNNTTHRHFVGKGSEKRVSFTFRMIK